MSGADAKRALLLGGSFLLCGLALLGCRDEEQDRVLLHEPGVYQGSPDATMELDEDTVEALNARAMTQQF